MASMHNTQPLLSRAECNILRGVAIIGIFLHNFCHWLAPIVKENEYTFSSHNVDVLNQVLAHPDIYLPVHLLSFFGHYGVPVFLFLSAFGLVCKYENPTVSASAGSTVGAVRFVRYHYLKLLKMMIAGFVAFVCIDAITPGRWHYTVTQVVAQLCMLNNLLPDPDHQIWPGPYWFFGLMLQLYVVYRLLLYRRHWGVTVVLMAVCVVLQLVMNPDGDAINRYRYNFMGGMLPFGLGLLYARYGQRLRLVRYGAWQWGLAFTVSCLLTYLCSLNFVLWAVVPAVICVGGVSMVKWIGCWTPNIAQPVASVLGWMGQISAALFVSHPIVRKILIPISRSGDIYAGLLLYLMAAVCVAWLFRLLMNKIPNPKL